MHLVNRSPCQALAVPLVASDDRNFLVVVVKATFKILAEKNAVKLSKEQREISHSDVHWGDPASSSVRYPGDIALQKPATDIGLVGHAYAPGKPIDAMSVSLKIGKLEKQIAVFGDRYWDTSSVGSPISSPARFDKMPLVYENAYGGSYVDASGGITKGEPRNPLGKGFYSPNTSDQPKILALPNLEDPRQLISERQHTPPPCCCGFVPQGWLPRRNYIGTYDDQWIKNRNPLLPEDFDTRAYLSASDGLRADGHLQGGEPVELLNLSPDGPLRFKLPRPQFDLETFIQDQRTPHDLQMDTVVFEPDDQVFTVTWSASIPIHWNLDRIKWIRLGLRKQKAKGANL